MTEMNIFSLDSSYASLEVMSHSDMIDWVLLPLETYGVHSSPNDRSNRKPYESGKHILDWNE